jgi:predicted DNA-binding protein (MmcQ/YjbR family)
MKNEKKLLEEVFTLISEYGADKRSLMKFLNLSYDEINRLRKDNSEIWDSAKDIYDKKIQMYLTKRKWLEVRYNNTESDEELLKKIYLLISNGSSSKLITDVLHISYDKLDTLKLHYPHVWNAAEGRAHRKKIEDMNIYITNNINNMSIEELKFLTGVKSVLSKDDTNSKNSL